ncbi:MAG: Wzz/FepE/Etk N-terminal domain-containing protein [Thermoleophilia bacterium]
MEESSTIFMKTDYRALLGLMWHRKWILIVSIVVITSLAVGYTVLLSPNKYQSTTELLRKRSGLDRALLGSDFFDQSVNPEREMQTASDLVKSPQVISAVEDSMGDRLGGKDADLLINVSIIKNSDILKITATDEDPQLAADVANSFAESYVTWRRQVDKEVVQTAYIPIEAQVLATPVELQETASYKVLKERLDVLKLMEATQTGNLEIVKAATVSNSPVSPKPVRTGIIAFFVSIIFGLGLIYIINVFDNSVRTADEITDVLDKPILGTIPTLSSSHNESLVTLSNPAGICSEAYRLLKTNMGYIEPDKEIKSIMITSVGPSEGKSTTIANLAVTMARSGQRVIVLEADLRRPMLSHYMQLDNAVGLTSVIAGTCSLREALQMIEAKVLGVQLDYDDASASWEQGQSAKNIGGIKPIYCVTSGPIPPNPGELVSSDKLGLLIEEACKYADIVLVDSPPLGIVGDAASLATKVDGVLIVVRLAKTAKKSLNTFQDFFNNVPCNVLGIVVTDSNAKGSYGGKNSYYENSGYY